MSQSSCTLITQEEASSKTGYLVVHCDRTKRSAHHPADGQPISSFLDSNSVTWWLYGDMDDSLPAIMTANNKAVNAIRVLLTFLVPILHY